MVLGHEGAGRIVKAGSSVTNISVNDRVSFEPGYPVQDDDFTKRGKYNLSKV